MPSLDCARNDMAPMLKLFQFSTGVQRRYEMHRNLTNHEGSYRGVIIKRVGYTRSMTSLLTQTQ